MLVFVNKKYCLNRGRTYNSSAFALHYKCSFAGEVKRKRKFFIIRSPKSLGMALAGILRIMKKQTTNRCSSAQFASVENGSEKRTATNR